MTRYHLIFCCLCLPYTMTHADPPPQKTQTDAMRELRLRMLTDPPGGFGIQPSREFPRTYGVLMDWPIGENTASVVSLCTGDASLYTTSTFGIIGGIGHETVRKVATAFVRIADRFHDDSVPTPDFPYPAAGRVRFYLVTFGGVRVIDTDLTSMETMTNKYFQAFEAGQAVLSELRLVTEKKQ